MVEVPVIITRLSNDWIVYVDKLQVQHPCVDLCYNWLILIPADSTPATIDEPQRAMTSPKSVARLLVVKFYMKQRRLYKSVTLIE